MKKLIIVLALAVLLGGCTTATVMKEGKQVSPIGREYYTKVNIWYEKQNKILSVNWHVGAILHAGIKVEIVRYGGNRVTFKAENITEPFTLVNASRYSIISLEELFKRYFSKEDIKAEGGILSKFTEEELANIKKGAITEGMSKEAVLVAYGYPPSNRTPDITSDYWQYFRNKFVRDLVNFQDNKVVNIERTARP